MKCLCGFSLVLCLLDFGGNLSWEIHPLPCVLWRFIGTTSAQHCICFGRWLQQRHHEFLLFSSVLFRLLWTVVMMPTHLIVAFRWEKSVELFLLNKYSWLKFTDCWTYLERSSGYSQLGESFRLVVESIPGDCWWIIALPFPLLSF